MPVFFRRPICSLVIVGKSLNAAVDHVLDGRVREADEFQGDRFTAENVDLIRLGQGQDLRIGIAGARQVHGGVRVGELMIVRARRSQQG